MSAIRAVLGAALIFGGCGPSEPPDESPRLVPRLVLLYVPCSVNKNFLSPYGENISFTPSLAEFARDSLVFERHYTEAGQSGIAYASIFSGSQADDHGVYTHPKRIEDRVFLVPEAYADAGYETFFWNEQPMVGPQFNYAQGIRPENVHERMLTADDPSFTRVLEKLRTDESYRAFVLTTFTVTHGPYDPENLAAFRRNYPAESRRLPERVLGRYTQLFWRNFGGLMFNFSATRKRLRLSATDLENLSRSVEVVYKSGINRLDTLFGAVVESVRRADLFDESLIVFTADHGEVLYRDNVPFKWGHSMELVPEVLTVPLIIGPRPADARSPVYDRVTRSIDVLPTMLALSGVSDTRAEEVRGVNLVPALRGLEEPPDLRAYSHTGVLVRAVMDQMNDPKGLRTWGELAALFPTDDIDLLWVSILEGDAIHKLTRSSDGSWQTEFFDLGRDPGERTNLYDRTDREHVAMVDELKSYKARLTTRYHEQRSLRDASEWDRSPTPQELEALRSLDYIE